MSTHDSHNIIRVMTVDDHPVLRDGLAALIRNQPDMAIVGEADDGLQSVALFRALVPDVTLMDLQMPVLGGVEAIKAIRAEFPNAKIVVLTTYDGDVRVVRALKAGAVGYMLKNSVRKELLEMIRAVHAGQDHLQQRLTAASAGLRAEGELSERETAVLRLVATGHANKKVAVLLSISEATVKAHLKSIFVKLAVADRAHAVTVANERGILGQ